MAGAKSRGEQQTERRLRVLDLASFDHLQSSREWHWLRFEKFIRFMLSLSGGQSGCYEEMDFLVSESGRCVHREQLIHVFGGTARLLLQLPEGAVAGSLPRIQPPRRNLVQITLGSVPILPDQEDLGIFSGWIAEKGDHRARAWMPNHLELAN